MRKLKTSDIFALSRCLKTIGIKDEITKIAEKGKGKKFKDANEAGFELIYNIFDIATENKAEKEIYEFLAQPFEMKPEEVEDLPLNELIEDLKQLGDMSTITTFFKQAVR